MVLHSGAVTAESVLRVGRDTECRGALRQRVRPWRRGGEGWRVMLAQVRHRDGLPRQESCTAIGDDSVRATAGDRCRQGMVREDRGAPLIENRGGLLCDVYGTRPGAAITEQGEQCVPATPCKTEHTRRVQSLSVDGSSIASTAGCKHTGTRVLYCMPWAAAQGRWVT